MNEFNYDNEVSLEDAHFELTSGGCGALAHALLLRWPERFSPAAVCIRRGKRLSVPHAYVSDKETNRLIDGNLLVSDRQRTKGEIAHYYADGEGLPVERYDDCLSTIEGIGLPEFLILLERGGIDPEIAPYEKYISIFIKIMQAKGILPGD